MDSTTPRPRIRAGTLVGGIAWTALLATGWTLEAPGLAALALWAPLCPHGFRRPVRAAPRIPFLGGALADTATALLALVSLQLTEALSHWARPPSAEQVAAAERRAAVAKSIAKALQEGAARERGRKEERP